MDETGGAGCSPEKGDYSQGIDVDVILLSGGASLIRALMAVRMEFFDFDIGLVMPGVGWVSAQSA
jgi:hypothetical protein